MATLEYRLLPELVPSTCFYTNVRSAISASDWKKLKVKIHTRDAYKCVVCSKTPNSKNLHCHEVWQYDDAAKIQRLIDMVSLCAACHECKHVGFAEISGRLEYVIRHMSQINNISEDEACNIISDCFEIWAQRSKSEWKCDISLIKKYLS